MLKGEAKKIYMRKYMRERRSNGKDVRPNVKPLLDPALTETVGKMQESIGRIKVASANINEILAPVRME